MTYRPPLRLRFHHHVDRLAVRLIDHGQHRAALALWRTLRMVPSTKDTTP
ncbi:hypothetical protein [Streptomyces scabiei]|jgi:hypothetical protein|nr:hypothetical protein [Streptomyces scabiei]